MSKRPLPDDRKAECLRLKRIFNLKKAELGLTQEKLAERLGINQSSVSHYLNAVNPLNATVAAGFAKILEVQISEFSPRLAHEIELLTAASVEANRAFISNRVAAHQAKGVVPYEEYVLIPQYMFDERFVKGINDEHVGLTEGLVFRRGWLRRMGVSANDLFVVYADGNDMAPHICAMDVVLFDATQKSPLDRQIYVIRRRDGGITVKRMIQQLSGSWVIRSENPDKNLFPDEIVSELDIAALPIIGRVIWRGGSPT
ncbi:Peptidase S24 [Pseudomonas syringae pv. helianthi]|uniref:Peptidase S24 n=1 Tax=Pseudomonas syringae pv. helianthi TaxID=251654 RepID=A0A0P9RRV2_9PSED|nr:LexA family transcriptional regulator [Pseudomonas syringae group genomosp. 7]KPX49008.1 Peptidase S24 [Pseudomonas syringae pv. helianthi]UNB64181.1 LexA family transcriptional regulator [Pseudomonas syringae pv. helianthi]